MIYFERGYSFEQQAAAHSLGCGQTIFSILFFRVWLSW